MGKTVSVVKQISQGVEETFNFNTKTAAEATTRLDELVASGQVDVQKLREELAPYIVDPRKPKKAGKGTTKKVTASTVKSKKEKTPKVKKETRGRGASNEKRTKALEMFKSMTAEGLTQDVMIKKVMDELSITKPNAYYYYHRVFIKK